MLVRLGAMEQWLQETAKNAVRVSVTHIGERTDNDSAHLRVLRKAEAKIYRNLCLAVNVDLNLSEKQQRACCVVRPAERYGFWGEKDQ